MKIKSKLLSLLSAILLVAFIVSSCDENETLSQEIGEVAFGFSLSSDQGRIAEDANLTKVIYSLKDENGAVIAEDAIENISLFDGVYISDPISLNVGNYSITKFFVVGENDEVLYVTPVEESELAYLVETPLPINFSVVKDDEVKVTPEVISTDEGTEIEFGYGEFGFNIVGTFDLLIAAFTYDSDSEQYNLSNATLEISSEGEVVFEKELLAATNKVILSERFDSLVLTVTKGGYIDYEQGFTLDSLKQYDGTTQEGSLEIILDSVTNGLVAFYPFNGDANDESGNANDGIVNGAVLSADRNGNANSAYSFDGVDDFINIDNVLNQISSDVIGTLCFWVRPETSLPTPGEYLVTMGETSDYGWMGTAYFQRDGKSLIRFTSRIGEPIEFKVETDDNQLTSNSWTHLAFVQNGSIGEIYVNGELVSQSEIGPQNTPGSWFDNNQGIDNIRIGYLHQNNTTQGFFNGSFDELRIYDRALTSEEINILFIDTN